MPLKNFGSILNFAAELEADDQGFYRAAMSNPACAKYEALFEEFAKNHEKNKQLMLRTCRESVCEMILEPIVDFTREPFLSERQGGETMPVEKVMEKALELEGKAERFYTEAAGKIKALPEVAGALNRTGKRRIAQKKRLEELVE
ncbi:MAG: hypothetical protein P8182_19850 [Deltaproteobacteria bacterium]